MELRHCGNVLTPHSVVTFSPASHLLLDVKVRYRKARVSLIDSFQTVTHATFLCDGTCMGVVYAWQGVNYSGEEADVEKIKSDEVDLWASLIEGVDKKNAKGALSVQGSLPYWPFTKREAIAVQ